MCNNNFITSDMMEVVQFSYRIETSSLAVRARLWGRLLSITFQHAAARIFVIPSISHSLHLLPYEFQIAVQWWLGISPSSKSSQDEPI